MVCASEKGATAAEMGQTHRTTRRYDKRDGVYVLHEIRDEVDDVSGGRATTQVSVTTLNIIHHKPADLTDWSGSACVSERRTIQVALPPHTRNLVYVLRHFAAYRAKCTSGGSRSELLKTLQINGVRQRVRVERCRT
jgi:hypothetical protein